MSIMLFCSGVRPKGRGAQTKEGGQEVSCPPLHHPSPWDRAPPHSPGRSRMAARVRPSNRGVRVLNVRTGTASIWVPFSV